MIVLRNKLVVRRLIAYELIIDRLSAGGPVAPANQRITPSRRRSRVSGAIDLAKIIL